MNLTIPFPGFERLQLNIAVADNVITGVDYRVPNLRQHDPDPEFEDNGFAEQIRQQFQHYFVSGSYRFSLPCQMTLGTAFQQRVWQALIQIPSGQAVSYGALAKTLNSSARAVGNACRNNPFAIIIPCHRVVSASGIGGYAGDTVTRQNGEIDFVAIKRWLLDHEQA